LPSSFSRFNFSVAQVVNLEDIIAERGACGVGFIANLDNKGHIRLSRMFLLHLVAWNIEGGVVQIMIRVMVRE